MQYSKSMIDLVFQIRKHADPRFKPRIKLSNPDLLDNLIEIYFESHNKVLRADIESLLTLVGSVWRDTLLEQRRNSRFSTTGRKGSATISAPPLATGRATDSIPTPEQTDGDSVGSKATADHRKIRMYRGVKTSIDTL